MEQPGDEAGEPERIRLLEVIRQRIRSGYYESPRAMDRLARALVRDTGALRRAGPGRSSSFRK